jgi:hypothetical protein
MIMVNVIYHFVNNAEQLQQKLSYTGGYNREEFISLPMKQSGPSRRTLLLKRNKKCLPAVA